MALMYDVLVINRVEHSQSEVQNFYLKWDLRKIR